MGIYRNTLKTALFYQFNTQTQTIEELFEFFNISLLWYSGMFFSYVNSWRFYLYAPITFADLCTLHQNVTGEFPAQMASNAENVSIWWRHHEHQHLSIYSIIKLANIWWKMNGKSMSWKAAIGTL